MATEIKVPTLGESVTEATVARWLKPLGAAVAVDDPLVELETDKVTLEVNATAAGTLSEITAPEGTNVAVGAVLGLIGEAGVAVAAAPVVATAAPAPVAAPAASASDVLSPAVRKLIDDNKLNPTAIAASGKDGRLTKEDVQSYLDARVTTASAPLAAPAPVAAPAPRPTPPAPKPVVPSGPRLRADREERVRMTRLRQRVAERLK